MHAASRLIRVGFTLFIVLAGTTAALAESWRVSVKGDGTDLGETPVVVELKRPIPAGAYVLDPADQRGARPAQVFVDEGKTYLATILARVSGGGRESYTLRPDESSQPANSGVALVREGANVKVLVDGNLFTEYLSDQATKPYYYPVIGPTGAAITRHHPMKAVEGEAKDHNHQRSLWFSHMNVNGYDFWGSDPLNKSKKNDGKIKETAKKTLVAGPVLGRIRTTDDWLGPDGKRVCEDERVVTIYDVESARVLDFDVRVKATDAPVTFFDNKDGTFGLRVASSMDVLHGKVKGQGKITNAEGITDDDAWGKASSWVDYVGPVDGQIVGVAILNHPDSFRYPTTWHVRNYGLFAANPFGWHDFGMKKSGDHTIPGGESIRFGYRIIFHKGDTASARLDAAFQGYAHPPTVEVE
jgi:Methane oxygenase PmoA